MIVWCANIGQVTSMLSLELTYLEYNLELAGVRIFILFYIVTLLPFDLIFNLKSTYRLEYA